MTKTDKNLILSGGKVVTLDTKGTIAEAVAISGDCIIAVGEDAAVSATAGPDTERIDLAGRTAILLACTSRPCRGRGLLPVGRLQARYRTGLGSVPPVVPCARRPGREPAARSLPGRGHGGLARWTLLRVRPLA